jgi:hypothetical protein
MFRNVEIGYNKAELARLKLDREVSATVSYFRKAKSDVFVFIDNHVDIPQKTSVTFHGGEISALTLL